MTPRIPDHDHHEHEDVSQFDGIPFNPTANTLNSGKEFFDVNIKDMPDEGKGYQSHVRSARAKAKMQRQETPQR